MLKQKTKMKSYNMILLYKKYNLAQVYIIFPMQMIAQNLEWIKEGLYIDARDKYGDWQAGLIMTVTKSHIKIRFDGWSSKIDQVYPLITQRIKPFRSITKGYTGQKKSPSLRQHWTFTPQNHEQRLAKFEQFVNHISQKSGFEMNQYLRGQNYFYIDFLLGLSYNNVQTIKRVYDYFKANFQFAKTYFQQFIETDPTEWFQAGQKQQLTPKKVYADAHYEIFESIAAITGSIPRCSLFFKLNKKVLQEMYGSEMTYENFIAKELNNINLLACFDNVIIKIFNEANNGIKNTSLAFISSLYFFFTNLQKLPLTIQFKKKVNFNFFSIIKNYVNSMTIQDAKTHQKTIQELLNRTRLMCNRITPEEQEICRWVQRANLKLWLYLIQCDVLEKKLRGITGLKEFYEQINRKLSTPYKNNFILCSKEQFRQFIDQQNLMKIIFQTNEHSQVIKKGCEMVYHFYVWKNKVCTMEDIVYIWDTCFGKHEAIRRIILGFWKDYAPYVVGENDWRLFIGVVLKNEQQICEDWEIEALFGLMRTIKSDDSNESITQFIKLMYRKTLADHKYIPLLAKQLSFFDSSSKILQNIVNHCLQQISQKSESIFHLQLLSKLYNELHNYKSYIPENIIVVLIEELKEFITRQQNQRLVHTIINLLDEIIVAKNGGVSPGNPNGVRLTFQNFETLWQIFTKCQIRQFRRIFFTWLATPTINPNYNYTTYIINNRFSQEFMLYIFSNILCDESKFNYKKLDLYEFSVFKEFFIYSNVKAGALESKSQKFGYNNQSFVRRIIRTKTKEIQGLKELWDIFKGCQNDEVVVGSSIFLKDLYLRAAVGMSVEDRNERIKSLMEIIQTSIVEGQKNANYSLVKRTLILISELLIDIKQKIEISKEHQKFQKGQTQIIKVYMNSRSDAQQIQVCVYEPFIVIKNQIAKKFHIAKDQFTLMCGKFQIIKQFYDLPFHLFTLDEPVFRISKIQNETGKYIIGNICQHIYQRIIGFLRNQQVCMQAFHLLEYLDIYEPVRLFERLSQDIQDMDEILKNKKKLYLHIFFTRVFLHITQRKITNINSTVLQKLLSHLQIPIETPLIINYLQKIIQILTDLHKNYKNCEGQETQITLSFYRPKLYNLMLNLVKYMNKNNHIVSSHEIKLFNSSFSLYMNGFDSQKTLFDTFIKDPNFREFMFEIFIKCEVLQVKKTMEKKIATWLKEGFCSVNQERKVAHFFINELYYAIYQKDSQKEINGVQFTGIFKLFRTIIESISWQTFKQIIHENPCPIEGIEEDKPLAFSNHIFQSISRHSDSQASPNFMLNGQLQILVGMIRRDRSLINQRLIDYLFYQCLIYVHGKTSGMEVKCLFKENISLVLEILWYAMVIVESQEQTINNTRVSSLSLDQCTDTILKKLRQFHYTDEWRNAREWSTEYMQLSKTKHDFVGLENPGCICYLNSLLQQLYMIEEFRSSVLNMTTQKPPNQQCQIDMPPAEQDSPQLITKLKLLFLNLMYSQRPAIDPQFFTSSIRTTGNRPMVKISQQMDIDEFSMILFDKIQSKIHRYKAPNFIRELFGGAYSNEIISQECSHSSQRQEQFLSISLDVKKHINESFQSLVKGEMLEGENAYFCDRCDKKVRALKRLSIKRLPPHLIISLRRFEFDYEVDQKIKINKYCQFPFELNLENYSPEKLNELAQQTAKKPDSQYQPSTSSMPEQQVDDNHPKNNFPPEYFQYKLKGVVIHTGSADSGHYYSYIETKDGRWFEFNDEKVTEFDVKNLGDEAFGGKDGEYIRIRNAYLLFYERKDETKARESKKSNYSNQNSNSIIQNTQTMPQQPYVQVANPISQQQNKRLIEQIVLQKRKIRLWNFFFSKQYMQFVINFIKQALYPIFGIKTNEYLRVQAEYFSIMPSDIAAHLSIGADSIQSVNRIEHELFQFIVSYTFLIQIRHKNYWVTFELLEAITKIFFEHPDVQKRFNFIEVFLEEICQQSFFDEFFINCSPKEISKIIGNFIFNAISSYLTLCEIDEAQPIPKVIKTILKLIMRTVIKTNTNIAEILIILRKILALKHTHQPMVSAIISFLLKKDFVTTIVDNAFGIETPKDLRAKRIHYLENDNNNPVEAQQIIPEKYTTLRKNSDISAKDQNQGSPTKKKHLNEKIEIQGEEKSLDTIRYSVLFGQYSEDAGVAAKTSERQTWIILYEIQQEIKSKKNQIDEIKQKINQIKKIPVQQQKPQFLFPQLPKTNPPQGQNMNSQNPMEPSHVNSELSSQMQEQSSSDESLNRSEEDSQESSLNAEDCRQVNEAIRMVTQVQTEVVSMQKANRQSQKGTGDATQQQPVHVIDVEFGAMNNGRTEGEQVVNTSLEQNTQKKGSQNPQSPRPSNSMEMPQISSQPKSEIQLTAQQQQQLSILQTLLTELEITHSAMDFKFHLPLNKLKPEKIMKVLSEQKDTKSIIAIAAFISELVFNTISFNQTILIAIENGFKDYESSKYRPFFLVVEKLLEIQDDLTKKRRHLIFNVLWAAFRHNEKFFLECDFIQQFILRYVTKVPAFQVLLKETPGFLNEMKNWIAQKKTPGTDTVKKHRLPNCQRLSLRLHGILVSSDIKDYETLSVHKYDSFQKIKLNRYVPSNKYQDNPQVGETYSKGDRIEVFFDMGRWLVYTVQETYFGYLLIQMVIGGNKIDKNLVSEDDDKIRLVGRVKIEEGLGEKMEIEK